MTQPTCEERIAKKLGDREDTVSALYRAMDEIEEFDNEAERTYNVEGEDLTPDEAREHLDELALSIEKKTVIKVALSWGGPEDFLEGEVDDEGPYRHRLVSLEYHFRDWFDGARRSVPGDSPLWRYVEDQIELLP